MSVHTLLLCFIAFNVIIHSICFVLAIYDDNGRGVANFSAALGWTMAFLFAST